MMLPDYIIIGAMKCGTSTLAAQLGAQRGVFMTTPKEPNYFSDDAVFGKGDAWYSGLFAAASEGDLKGEASTHYTKLPTYPETIARLKATGATPRLIYLIRDPVQRLVSHYIHEWTQGVITGTLEEAIISHPELRAYSRYGEQIRPWVDAFGVQNILILNMSELKSDPQGLLDRVGAFLGRDGLVWKDDLSQMNVSAERIRRFPLHGLVFDNSIAEWLRRSLIPQGLRDRIKASRQMDVRPELSIDTRRRLIDEFNADRVVLASVMEGKIDIDTLYPELTA